jgi:hypothetical protein
VVAAAHFLAQQKAMVEVAAVVMAVKLAQALLELLIQVAAVEEVVNNHQLLEELVVQAS